MVRIFHDCGVCDYVFVRFVSGFCALCVIVIVGDL